MYKGIRKVACIASLALLPSMVFAEEGDNSGFFAGINMGYSVGFTKMTSVDETTIGTTAPTHINIGFQLGYNHYFLDFLGARLYLDYNYGFNHSDSKMTSTGGQAPELSNTLASAHAVSVNVDALVNLINTESFGLGAFVGIGLGYGAMSSTETAGGIKTTTPGGSGFILPINVGLSLMANGHHRFELGFKIPTIGLKQVTIEQGGGAATTTITRTMIGSFGYSYVF